MTSIVTRVGDLTNSNASAIVNAGNTSLWLGTGVSGAIRTRGGPSIQVALDRIAAMVRESPDGNRLMIGLSVPPVKYGDVTITHAGYMRARFILHAAVMHSRGPMKGHTNLDIVRECTKNCMLASRQYGFRGIAFPILGTGVGSLTLADSTRAMVETIFEYPISDFLVRMYAYDQAAFDVIDPIVQELRVL